MTSAPAPAEALISIVAAAYTLAGVGMNMSPLTTTRMAIEMPGMVMQPVGWSAGYAFVIFLMWCVMMVAMMVPSAAPIVFIHPAIGRKQENADRTLVATAIFVAGYLTVWTVFSLVATAFQWGLESLGIVTRMMEIASPVIAGLVLISAGLYQLTPLKRVCLKHCQNPMTFIIQHWRPGKAGAFRMGLEHGGYCLGCCWFLMALLFVGGIMNLIWIAGIAVYVGIEKFAVANRWLTIATGVTLTIGSEIAVWFARIDIGAYVNRRHWDARSR
jgi:predicted metal-binding membrane protein